jgi:hypothetical protein
LLIVRVSGGSGPNERPKPFRGGEEVAGSTSPPGLSDALGERKRDESAKAERCSQRERKRGNRVEMLDGTFSLT